MITQPLFLVGAERSGTTMLRLMIDHHPRIAISNEFEYVVDLLSEDHKWPDLEHFYEHLQKNRIFEDQNYEIDQSLDYPSLANSFLQQCRDRENKAKVGAAVHRHFDRLPKIWPNARYIHLVRDPRDVARSCIGMGWASNVWTGVNRWIEAEYAWERLRDQLDSSCFIELRFEDLVADPQPYLDQICSIIDEKFDSAMLTYPNQTTYSNPDPSLCYQWKQKLSDREIRLVESRIGSLLTSRGYEHSGLSPLQVSTALEQRLRVQDRLGRIRFKIDRYGWRLSLENWISKRFGPGSWQERVRQRLQDIQRKHLK